MKGYIVDTTYETIDEKTQIHLFGRLENGQSFVSIHNFTPYFYIRTEDVKKVSKYLEKYKTEDTNLTNFKKEKVTKIYADTPALLSKLPSVLHKLECETYEADIKPITRFLIDNNILTSLELKGDYDVSANQKVDRIYHNPSISPSNYIPKLNILSVDTESDEKGNLFCIGLSSENYEKCFIISDKKLKNAISCKNEEDCLEKFKAELIKIDPDVITGWNFIDFDLPYLQKLFIKHKIKQDFGRNNDNMRLRIESNFFRSSSASITGRQVLDGLNLIRDPFIKEAPSIKKAEFESYSLEDVSQSILGSGKLIKGKNRHVEIEEIYKTNQQKLIDYNLQDCKLVYEILKKTKILDLAIERSQLTGMTFDRLTASIVAFDSLYLRETKKRNLVCPTTHYQQKENKIMGGYVKQSKSGIYQNVLVLDFKSLYPSIIKTFNIDPSSFLGKKKEKNAIETPNHVFFRNEEGILPEIIHKLHEAREKAKKEGREFSNYAIKIIMNSFYGVLASENSRFFDFEMASAITNFAQYIIKLTAEEIEKTGLDVIYSDTDSVFVVSNLNKEKSRALGKKIQDTINSFYDQLVKEKYHRKSFLELEFEKLYLSLMFPNIRNNKGEENEKAAKKRYAGLVEKHGKEELEIVGLEAIRGDWTEAAQEFQRELLMKTFHQEPVEKFIKEYVSKIKAGKLDEKLVYRKSIRKNLDEYTKTTPPHVKAARKLDKLEGNLIEYYITEDGPEPIQKLKHKLNYEHYIEKQIKPIANQILSLFDKDFDDSAKGQKQSKLF